MARQWRIKLKDGIYHVLSRGNNKKVIFEDDKDRELFLSILGKAAERFLLEIYGYVLMGNHYHLLIKTREANLSQCMQWIGSLYTQKYNFKHQQVGHLFQGRFKSILVEDETYLLQLSYYIHRNPIRAGLVKRLLDYKWSSYPAYAYKNTKYPDWLDTEFILSKFPSNDPYRSYRLQAQAYSDENKKVWEEVKHGVVYGSEKFIEKIRSNFLKNNTDTELPQHNQLKKEVDLDKFIEQAYQLFKFDLAQKISRHSSLDIRESRNAFIYFIKTHTSLSNQKIGDRFGLSYSAVSKITSNIQAEINTNMRIQRKVELLNSHFKV